jgi:hypothetical protein
MRFEPSGHTNDADIRVAKSIVDYVFRWMGKRFVDVDQQEEIGILSPEVRARLAAGYANGGTVDLAAAPAERRCSSTPGLLQSHSVGNVVCSRPCCAGVSATGWEAKSSGFSCHFSVSPARQSWTTLAEASLSSPSSG